MRVSEFSAVSKLLDELPLIRAFTGISTCGCMPGLRPSRSPKPVGGTGCAFRRALRLPSEHVAMLMVAVAWLSRRATPNAPKHPDITIRSIDAGICRAGKIMTCCRIFEPLKDLPPGPEDDECGCYSNRSACIEAAAWEDGCAEKKCGAGDSNSVVKILVLSLRAYALTRLFAWRRITHY